MLPARAAHSSGVCTQLADVLAPFVARASIATGSSIPVREWRSRGPEPWIARARAPEDISPLPTPDSENNRRKRCDDVREHLQSLTSERVDEKHRDGVAGALGRGDDEQEGIIEPGARGLVVSRGIIERLRNQEYDSVACARAAAGERMPDAFESRGAASGFVLSHVKPKHNHSAHSVSVVARRDGARSSLMDVRGEGASRSSPPPPPKMSSRVVEEAAVDCGDRAQHLKRFGGAPLREEPPRRLVEHPEPAEGEPAGQRADEDERAPALDLRTAHAMAYTNMLPSTHAIDEQSIAHEPRVRAGRYSSSIT